VSKIPLISIVDDDESVREALNRLIRSLGYDTATFASAEAYLYSERLSDTSCLITDVQMPGINGVELHNRLVANGHSTPVIFMTAFPDENIRARAFEAGAFGFLSKPLNEDSLCACLDEALEVA
jgi:FixJ family two-component response regulator